MQNLKKQSGEGTHVDTQRIGKKKRLASQGLALAALGASSIVLASGTLHASTDTWVGVTSKFSNASNWTGGNSPPATNDALSFATAGAGGLTLIDDYLTPAAYNISGITFTGPSAFIINPNVVGTNGFTLTGNITDSGTALETINDAIATTAVRTVTMTTGGGNVTLGGSISGAAGGITTAGAGTLTLSGTDTYTGATTVGLNTTLTFGANNVLGSNASSLTNVVMTSGGLTNTIDLAGTTQSIGTLTTSSTNNSGGTITSSAAGGSLTINEGAGANGNLFGGTVFSGALALTVAGTDGGSAGNNIQILNTADSYSGGLTIKSSTTTSAGTLATANLAVAGGLTGETTEGIRSNATAPLGTGPITLDNGRLFMIASLNVTNTINVTARGGVLHMESTGVSGNGFSGTLNDSGGLLVINSNSGNSNTIKLSGAMTGFSGTIALDTTNIGGVAFGGSALGNSNTNLLWFGNGSNGGTGQVESALTSSGTLTFGELNNLNSGSVGSTFSGVVENTVASTTSTFSIGDSNTTAATFQGVIKNNVGTVALNKTGTNTQILSGANTYTGPTNVSGGTLSITGSLASGSTATVLSGTLRANGSGVIAGPINVNGGGAVGGTGTVSGLITLATGSTAATQGQINLVGSAPSTFSVTNAAGLTLGGTSGNAASLDLDATNKIAISGPLIVNAGGASIYVTPGTAAANSSYTLMTFANGSGAGYAVTSGGVSAGSLTLADPSLSFGVSGTLSVTSTALSLVTTGSSAPTNAYWSGALGTSWNSNNGSSGNFTTDGVSNYVTSLPANSTNVYFAGTGAVNVGSNTLGQAFDIKSLTFLGTTTTPANIGGSNQLTIESGGITLQAGNGGATLAMSTLGLGSSQTWTNNSSNPLIVTSAVTGTGVVLTIGAGTVDLGGPSFTTGTTGAGVTVNGTLDIKGTSILTGDLAGTGTITNTGANATLTMTPSTNSTFSGTLADGGSGESITLIKNGAATLTLSGPNTYTGATTVNAGTLQLGSSSALGGAGTGTSTVVAGATLDLNGQSTPESITMSGTGVGGLGALINSNTSSTGIINQDMLSSPSFTVGGPGNITLQRVQSGAVFTLTDISTGTLTLGTSATTGQNNLLNLVVSGGGTVLLNMPANYIAIDRGLTITNGTVQFTGASTDEITTGGAVNLSSGTLDFNGHTDTAGIGALVGTGGIVTNTAAGTTVPIIINTTTTNTYSGAITDGAGSGIIAITVTGTAGIETFAGANNYSGGTTVAGGADLIMGSATALGTVPAPLAVNTATLDLNGHNLSATTFSGTGATSLITSNSSTGATATLTVNSGTNATYAGQINNSTTTSPDALALVKNGSSVLTLSGSSTYSGGTTIDAGSIVQTAAGAIGTGTITLGSGSGSNNATLQGSSGSSITNVGNIITTAGGTGTNIITETAGGDYKFSGSVTLNSPLTLQTTSNGALFINGQITGASLITIDGGGATSKFVDFAGNNATTFTGNLLIQNKGSFKTTTNGIGAASTVTMDASGTVFDTGVTNVTVAGFNDVVTGAGGSSVIDAGVGSNLTLAGTGTYSFSGAISSSGNLVKTGTGTQTLAGANTYTGSTNVSGGTLILASAGAFPSTTTSSLTIGSNATVMVANHGSNPIYVPQTSALTNSGTLNVTNNDILVHNGSIGTIFSQIALGYNGGSWNGTNASSGVITSSTAAGDTSYLTAVGVATGLTSFEGLTVASTDVLVKYTYYGDTNLDGAVDGSDYTNIDNGFANHLTGWQNGDFNYDGVVDGSDYTLIDNAYNTQGASLGVNPAELVANTAAQISAGTSAVPEPTTLGLLGIGAAGLLARRSRRRS